MTAGMARHLRRRWLLMPALIALLVVGGFGIRQVMQKTTERPRVFKEIRWYELVPKEWDPTKRFRELNLDAMRDSDPRTDRLLRDMRATWDNAPTVSAMDGAGVKLAGYVVPLDGTGRELREFLLVPYFGACVHSPPPPANQIVHVTALHLLQGLRTMDAVWVSGTMNTARQSSIMGVSGYRIEAESVEHYVPRQ